MQCRPLVSEVSCRLRCAPAPRGEKQTFTNTAKFEGPKFVFVFAYLTAFDPFTSNGLPDVALGSQTNRAQGAQLGLTRARCGANMADIVRRLRARSSGPISDHADVRASMPPLPRWRGKSPCQCQASHRVRSILIHPMTHPLPFPLQMMSINTVSTSSVIILEGDADNLTRPRGRNAAVFATDHELPARLSSSHVDIARAFSASGATSDAPNICETSDAPNICDDGCFFS